MFIGVPLINWFFSFFLIILGSVLFIIFIWIGYKVLSFLMALVCKAINKRNGF